MDTENLSPMVYSMEQLEKVVGHVTNLGMRDEMFEVGEGVRDVDTSYINA